MTLTRVEALLRPVLPEMVVGWPDDEVVVDVTDPDALGRGLTAGIDALRSFWTGVPLFADVDVYTPARRLDVRIVRVQPPDADERAEAGRAVLEPALALLAETARASGGDAVHGWSAGFFHLWLPVRSSGPEIAERESFPALAGSTIDARHAEALARTSWTGLRAAAYRFCDLATATLEATRGRATRVLVPSVGICVHPWLFADRGMSVVATDVSPAALEALRYPERRPRLYGGAAKKRWGISRRSLHGGAAPEHFRGMPELERPEVLDALRPRVTLLEADWAALPLADASVDLIFATNALPRGEPALLARVVTEWARVVRPDGVVLSAMHRAGESVREVLEARGFRAIDLLGGEPIGSGGVFQEWHTSG